MLNCEKATHLMSESLEHPLTFGQRLSLGIHMLVCRMCAATNNKFQFIQAALEIYDKRLAELAPDSSVALPHSAKAEIISRLRSLDP